jgi:hypothetical protein
MVREVGGTLKPTAAEPPIGTHVVGLAVTVDPTRWNSVLDALVYPTDSCAIDSSSRATGPSGADCSASFSERRS